MALSNEERIIEQQKIIEDLTNHVAKYETLAHELRQTQNKLDAQISTYGLIHKYTQMAFAYEEEDLSDIIAEGVVDVFQLEVGGVYTIDLESNSLVATGSCNLPDSARIMAIPEDDDMFLVSSNKWKGFYHESSKNSKFGKALGFSTMVCYILLDNKKQPEGVILGGITKDNEVFYDFSPELSKSSFIVYCQQMNGIMNNFEAIKQAKHAGDAKTRFLANLSHEIRTPMNAILGMAKIAEGTDDKDEVKKCIRQIDSSSQHLLTLINDVLDISKVEEGKLSLAHNPFSLNEMLEMLLNNITPGANAKNQNFVIEKDNKITDMLLGDSLRLSQVIINMLSNAIKFTPENGRIELHIMELKKDANKILLMFTVTDTGIGISEDKLESIFNPFEQADTSTSRKYGGTGLGLAISKRIVELMGGQIIVDSEIDKGSKFSFNIWLDIDQGMSADSEDTTKSGEDAIPLNTDLSGRKIMIVDDVDINREIVKAFLADTRVDMDEAEDGQQAFDMFNESTPGEYSLILMDVQMPNVDGCVSTEMIRALDRDDAETIPIYAMTANVFKEDVQQVINAGMNGHIGKPVDCDLLIETVVGAIKNQ